MALDTSLITKLRDMTGAGIADCKEALVEADNDLDKAVELLRKKGAAKAAKKMAERTAGEGLIGSYIHANGKIGVLVELRCETDFVARNEAFQQLAKDLSMQVAGANPLYLSPKEVPQEVIDREKGIYQEQLATEGKPAEMMEKIIEGKLQKFYQEVCLLKQAFIKDDSITIEQLVQDNVAKLGEKIEVAKFVRYQI